MINLIKLGTTYYYLLGALKPMGFTNRYYTVLKFSKHLLASGFSRSILDVRSLISNKPKTAYYVD